MGDTKERLKNLNQKLKEHIAAGHHIPGVIEYSVLADFLQPDIRVISIDTDPTRQEICHLSGAHFGFRRNAILRLANAGGIDLTFPPNHLAIEKGKSCTVKVIGIRRELSGSEKMVEDGATRDLSAVEEEERIRCTEEIEKDNPSWDTGMKARAVERCVQITMRMENKKAPQSVITIAQGRVVTKLLGLKGAYTLDELQKPFVIVSAVPYFDVQDPSVKEMVYMNIMSARARLYGRGPDHSNGDAHRHAGPIPAVVPVSAHVRIGEADFKEYPRKVRERIVDGLVKDTSVRATIPMMNDFNLCQLFKIIRAA